MSDRADGAGLAVRERTHEHVVIAAIVTVPGDPYRAITVGRDGGVPGVGRRFAPANFRPPNATVKRFGIDGGLPIAKSLPSQPKIAPARSGRALGEVRSVGGGQPLDRAP